jgi:mono/diheme cytochrome c family protein
MPHETPDPARGQKTFQRNCAPCHGDEGRGDGPEAARFFRPAMDLRKGDFWYTGRDLTPAQLHTELARIVRFGVFGTSMPGHETFTDQQVADVAAYVQQLSQVHE